MTDGPADNDASIPPPPTVAIVRERWGGLEHGKSQGALIKASTLSGHQACRKSTKLSEPDLKKSFGNEGVRVWVCVQLPFSDAFVSPHVAAEMKN